MHKSQVPKPVHRPQFDLKTHVRDKKGNIVSENHYSLNITNHIQEFERPPKSGYFYDSSGTLLRSPGATQPQEKAQASELDVNALLEQIKDLQSKLADQKDVKEDPHLEEKEEIPAPKAFVKPGFIKK